MLGLLKLSDLVFVALVAVNTFLNVDGIGRAFGATELLYTKQPTNTDQEIEVAVVSRLEDADNWTSVIDETSCSSSINPSVTVVCPHASSTENIAIMSAWGAFYFILFAVRLYYAWRFSFTDYRFVFFLDQFNSSIVQKILFGIGAAGTIATFGFGLHYAVQDNDGNPPEVGLVWPLFMFLLTNLAGLFFSAQYARTHDRALWDNEFTEEIPIKELPGGNGIINVAKLAFNRQAFFTEMQFALTDQFAGRGGLEKLTDKPELLQKMMVTLAAEESDDKPAGTAAPAKEESAPAVVKAEE